MPMNPRSTSVLMHSLARLLPLHRYQSQVYRLADKNPPGLEGYAPMWEQFGTTLGPRQTTQHRFNLQREFHLLALTAGYTTGVPVTGFRAQLYDQNQKRRMADRGVNWNNLTGPGSAPFFLRSPYPMISPEAQMLLIVQNQDAITATFQIVLYGEIGRAHV